jgi:hypothetical protein
MTRHFFIFLFLDANERKFIAKAPKTSLSPSLDLFYFLKLRLYSEESHETN